MSFSKHAHVVVIVLLLVLTACHSNSQPASTKAKKSAFPEEPIKSGPVALRFDTVSPQIKLITEKLDDFYQKQVRVGFSGTVLIGYKGNIIYERAYGYSNKEKKIPQNSNSSSQLASVSKTFTGAAVLYLYQRKYINLDEPVQSYLHDFPYPNITVRMLLDHRSGLPNYCNWVPNFRGDTRKPIDNHEMLSLMSIHKPHLEFKPNTRFTYSNTNYAVLALIVESVTKLTFYEFMDRYIFKPLGMEHTFVYDPAKGLPPGAALNYRGNWQREPDMFADGVYGDKGIYSTVEDMYRWDQSFYQNKLLNNETIELAYGPCSFERKGIKNYGLGWRMLCFPDGNKIIYHNGWWHGNNTSFYRFIKDNFTIVVLGNKFTNSVYHHAPAIVAIVKGSADEANFDTDD